MKFFSSLWNWMKKAKISSWNTTNNELSEGVKVPGTGRVGSYEEAGLDSEKIKGIKVTLPWPGDK